VLYTPGQETIASVLEAAEELRTQGYLVNTLPMRSKLGKQLSQLEAEGYAGYYTFSRGEVNWLGRA
jgi:hypothetical protein